MSTIIWVLIIHLNGAFCMEQVYVKFPTEQACEQARVGVDPQHNVQAECVPQKKE